MARAIHNYKKSQIDRIAYITKLFLDEFQHRWTHVYDEIDQAYDFLAGRQYTAKQRQFYETYRRPTDVFNLIFPLFNSVMGDLILSDQKIRAFAKPGGNAQTAAAIEDLLDHYHEDCGFRDHVQQTGLAGCAKVGYLYTRYSNEVQIDGSVVTTNLDEYEVMFDSRARDLLLDDAMYMFRTRWMTKEQIVALFPDKKKMIESFLRDSEDSSFFDAISDDMRDFITHPDLLYEKEGKYRVLEFNEICYEPHDVAYNTMTNESDLFSMQGKERERYLAQNPHIQIVELPHQKVKKVETLLPGMALMLEDSKNADLQDRTFDIVPFSAYNYGRRTIDNFGIFRNAVGPQKNFNMWQNQTQHLINQSAALAGIVNKEAIENPEDIEAYGVEPGVKLLAKNGYDIDKIWRDGPPVKFPFSSNQMKEDAAELLQKITGITPNQMGVEDTASENASLFAQRVRQARQSFQIIYNNMRRCKKRIAEKEVRLMQMHLTEQRYYLITNPETEEQRELVINQRIGNEVRNNLQLGEYGVLVDAADRNPTAKALRFLQKTELAQFIVETWGPFALDARWWLDDADLGDINKVVERIEMIQQSQMADGQQAGAMQDMSALMQLAAQKKQLQGEPQSDSGQRSAVSGQQVAG